ncbi:DUF4340 domain-containing protein [Leptospira sarikeiensis]|uniref:DUF4340 domain-containing protein n=1 Tax=Leptospira sarikeiensis TaxID=2484943 RepID=A0A4R9K0E3_9LEPT|nr:DUF4340 domain-containing protein [Leptospira sarikeiensis]TGL58481.1 DUF4340 domain-containing protein [Leptospira sarikeiensis]
MTLRNSIQTLKEKAAENPALTLFFTNMILGILLFLLYDPGDWFKRNYQNSEAFFKIKSEEIQTIITGRKGQQSILNRHLDGWTVQSSDQSNLPGDPARIEELIQACLHLRKFTQLTESDPISKEEFGLGGDEPILELKDVSGKSIGKILIGAPVRKGSGTYIMDEKNQIWLVKENLKLATGNGKLDFFLSRSLVPAFPEREKVVQIVIFPFSNTGNFSLIEEGGSWILQVSGQQIPTSSEEVELYLDQIKKLSADEVLLHNSEPILSIPKNQNFKIEIRTVSDKYVVSPIGMTKLGSYVFQREGLSYKLVLDPWNIERILQKDLAEFAKSPLSP